MNTLVRSATASLSRRSEGYEALDHRVNEEMRNHHSRRTFSKRRKEGNRVPYSRSYRNDRAKHRRIFLKSYKLATVERRSKSRKLKRFGVKVKKAVVSVLSFLGIGSSSLRSCDCRLAISASAPTPKPNCRE